MRLIDSDALKCEIATIMPSRTEVFLVVDKMPDAIVRCISCTFYRSNGECALHNGKWRPDGFCSWAIRKERGEADE